jgi:hypothetical protein
MPSLSEAPRINVVFDGLILIRLVLDPYVLDEPHVPADLTGATLPPTL